MRDIKFRYKIKNIHTLKIEYKIYTLNQVQQGGLRELFNIEDYEIIDIDRYTGVKDCKDVEIYENDEVHFGDKDYISTVMYSNGCFCIVNEDFKSGLDFQCVGLDKIEVVNE